MISISAAVFPRLFETAGGQCGGVEEVILHLVDLQDEPSEPTSCRGSNQLDRFDWRKSRSITAKTFSFG